MNILYTKNADLSVPCIVNWQVNELMKDDLYHFNIKSLLLMHKQLL